jgi:hypothetical protein
MKAYRAARARRADLERQLRSAVSNEAQQRRLREELERANGDLLAGRRQALGPESPTGGDGFDLLSSRHPLLLLPVRLETRFAWTDGKKRRSFVQEPGLTRALLVRVFPDEIHEDSHEPELTPSELRALADFDKAIRLATDLKHLRKAWGNLITRVGPNRAAWIASIAVRHQPPGQRASAMSRQIQARLLPDRWVAFAELDDGSTQVVRAPAPVREPVETGPSPDSVAWMRDFDAALAAGMALTIAIPPAVTEVTRLIVVGARGTLDTKESQEELQSLLEAHHFTRGLELLRPGVPSNSIPGDRAGYTTKPTFDDVFAVEYRRFLVGGHSSPLCQAHDESDGTRVAEAIGIDPVTFGYVRGADAATHRDGSRVRSLLVEGIRRRQARLLDGILDAGMLETALSFAIDWVNPLGPYAALRVGAQPYGLLPVQLRGDNPPMAGTFAEAVLPLLDALRDRVWAPAVDSLDRVGKPGADPGQTLIGILRQDAVAREIAFRPAFGPQLSARLTAQLGAAEVNSLQTRRSQVAALLRQLGAANPGGAPVIGVMQLPFSVPLVAPVIEPDGAAPASVQRAEKYLELIASLRLDQLSTDTYPDERPNTLLFSVARLALLEAADAAARELLQISMPAIDMSRWDDETVPSETLDPFGTPQRRLAAMVTLSDPLTTLGNTSAMWFHLSAMGLEKGRLQPWRDLLRLLKSKPPALLEEILRASLGVFSHRLDAWYTGLANEDLTNRVRTDPATARGLHIGAWSVIEHLRPAAHKRSGTDLYSDPANGGFIHAPSANHGAAAAVLRSIHLTHSAVGHGDAFSVDLSSARVRDGSGLLEGVRGGQPLGALLGYRIERELLAEGIPQFIGTFRKLAPLVANRLTPGGTEPVEKLAASNVVDGLVLLEKAGYDGSTRATPGVLWQNGNLGALPTDVTVVTALQRVLDRAQDLVDSVADLLLSESVYQAVHGNPLRAGATVDSGAGAPVPPTELDVVRTPRTGVGVTHRVLVISGDPTYDGDPGGWAATPRALAEPRLEACAQALLPQPDDIRIRAIFRAASGDVVESLDTTLGDVHRRAPQADAAVLRLSALDLVAQADPNDTPHRTALEVRIAALVNAAFPDSSHDGPIELMFTRDTSWDATRFGIVEVLEVARSLRDLVGHSRALTPKDFGHPETATVVTELSGDLAARLAAAGAGMLTVARTAGVAADLRRAIFAADAFGIAGAVPDSLHDVTKRSEQARVVGQLDARAAAVLAEIVARQRKVDALPPDAVADRLQATFGEAFKVVPLLSSGTTDPLGIGPSGAAPSAIRTWFARAARVRKGPQMLDEALAYAAAVSETTGLPAPVQWRAAQRGDMPGERWAALPVPAGGSVPGGRVSIVGASIPGSFDPGGFGGLFVDEWVDVVPSPKETTSVAFHCDAPTATAPQALLLGIPPAGMERWSAQSARTLVTEALALARIRLVDTDVLPQLGQLLPALYTVESTAGEAVGLDVGALTQEPS